MTRRNFIVNLLLWILAFFFGYSVRREDDNLNLSSVLNDNVASQQNGNNLSAKVEDSSEHLADTVKGVHVERFGAKGDGTDDTIAFKAAIAMMKTLNVSILIGEEKNYVVSDTLDFSGINRPVIWFKNSKTSRIEMISKGIPLIKANNIHIKGVWLHASDSIKTKGSIGVYITKNEKNDTNATMVKFEDVVVRGFYTGIYSDIEMDGLSVDGLILRDFSYRGFECNQNNKFSTAPTTAPVFKNFFVYSNKSYNAYFYVKGAWVPSFENAIFDGQNSFDNQDGGIGIIFHDKVKDNSSRTIGGKLSGIHFEDFRVAIQADLTSLVIENIRIQNSQYGIRRTSGNSEGELVFTEVHNSYINVRDGGAVLYKEEFGGRSYFYGVGCTFKGDTSLKTDNDVNGYSERVRLLHCNIDDKEKYIPSNITGESIVANDWIMKARHVLDKSGGGYVGQRISNNNNATILEYDIRDGTDTSKIHGFQYSANSEGIFTVNKFGLHFKKPYKVNISTISENVILKHFDSVVYIVDATKSNLVITLPFIKSDMTGITIIFKRIDSSPHSVQVNRGGNKIDYQKNSINLLEHESITFVCNSEGNLIRV